jgi:hypothetical protein
MLIHESLFKVKKSRKIKGNRQLLSELTLESHEFQPTFASLWLVYGQLLNLESLIIQRANRS